jgi:hypothetical protein
LITSSPITDEQKDDLARRGSDAVKKIIRNLNLDSASAQRVAMRFDEVVTAMSAKVSEVSLDPAATTSEQKRAREIMGKNFLGIEEVTKYYGMAFNQEQLAALATIPFSEGTLKQCKDTHLLVAGFPMTILEIRAKAPKNPKTFYSYKDAWYNGQVFATNERVTARWYLIRKDIVASSTSKNFDKQKALLSENEEVPRACEFIYTIVLYFLATGERLFEKVYARCVDLASGGGRVGVGDFDADGLVVSNDWDDDALDSLGLASARKFD